MTARAGTRRNLTLVRVELTNIRCFDRLDLDLGKGTSAIVLGDNGAGKSTLLRAVALGLCNESDTVALMKEVPGGFVRKGTREGTIQISLRDIEGGDDVILHTRIVKSNGKGNEIVRKSSQPADFPWDEIFVCGYGTLRSQQAVTSYDEYSARDAVLTLFDGDAALQNPELVLLRLPTDLRTDIERRLLQVLMLDDLESQVTYPKTGLEIRGPWGEQPLAALSDGYRSMAQWLLDYIAWMIYADRLVGARILGGILLIDEIEQHLHPRWQRHVFQRLQKQFPHTQILAATHSPLVAAGALDIEDSTLLRLTQDGKATVIDRDLLVGKRADQVLASEAFGLVTTRSPDSQLDISRYAELRGMASLSAEQETELHGLKKRLSEALRWGENAFERTVEQAIDQALDSLITNASRDLIDLEAKRQLRELFKDEKAS